ncbi:hypothetical protein ACP275_01G065400 [Erythranthe tilingii]
MECPTYNDDEYQKLVTRMSTPRSISPSLCVFCALEKVHYGKPKTEEGPTVLELSGTDRVGLLSEVFAVLSDLNCNVVNSKVWTHNGRIASLIYLNDNKSDAPIKDTRKLEKIEAMLRNVLKGDNDIRSAKTSIAENYLEKDYSVVNIHCKDRNKLLLDVVCTLTDMQYLIFHATVDTSADQVSLGVRLELCAADRKWLLADVMRTFRENGLNVTRAEIATLENKPRNIFYVTDSIGNRADPKIIQSVREKIGLNTLRVKELPILYQEKVDRDESKGGAPPRPEVQLTSVRG